ncbi:hypothetical protein [Microcoleus sp. LEGE 07076]|nr:hypothetical protein [Microcoleus sp. LEGE 07076]
MAQSSKGRSAIVANAVVGLQQRRLDKCAIDPETADSKQIDTDKHR